MDICFGLGYNTLATIYYIKKNNLNIKINIYSPEFDEKLVQSLVNFQYPKEFKEFKHIVQSLSQKNTYKDENINIQIFNGDAREYIENLYLTKDFRFDIIYQDAFSSEVNKSLWTVEYFKNIYKLLKNDAVLTTYSIATPIRLSLFESNFIIYEYKPDNSNRITIASNKKIVKENFKYIDMELKKTRNTAASALYD